MQVLRHSVRIARDERLRYRCGVQVWLTSAALFPHLIELMKDLRGRKPTVRGDERPIVGTARHHRGQLLAAPRAERGASQQGEGNIRAQCRAQRV